MSHMQSRFVKLLVLLLSFTIVANGELHAQAAQAAAELGAKRVATTTDYYLVALKDTVLVRLAGLVVAANSIRVVVNESNNAEWKTFLEDLDKAIAQGRRIERIELTDQARLLAEIQQFRQLLIGLRAPAPGDLIAQGKDNNALDALTNARKVVTTGMGFVVPSPTFQYTVSVNTVFSLGVSLATGSARVETYDVSTNLVGTALSALTGALGSNVPLQEYLAKNVAVGIGLPRSSSRAIEASYSIGLGNIETSKATFWPVLAMQQIDTASGAVPASVRVGKESENTWSVPMVGIGATWGTRDGVTNQLKKGAFVPVITLGIRLPYYYPGGAAGAFVALFGDNKNSFRGADKAQVALGISIPLLRNDPKPASNP